MAASLTRLLVIHAVAAAVLGAQPPRPRTLRADVAITVQGALATVQAMYDFADNPGALSFELLQQPCTIVGAVRAQSRGNEVALARDATAPWLRLHDTSVVDPARTTLGYLLSYEVQLGAGEVSVPVLLPVAVLRGSRRGDPIARLRVTLPEGMRVIAPRLARAADGTWTAQMAALPAAVRLAGTTPNECSEAVQGDSGRFKIIFWSLIATLALWVPAYLWWANRQRPAP